MIEGNKQMSLSEILHEGIRSRMPIRHTYANEQVDAYLRVGKTFVEDGERVYAVTLARIEVDAEARGKGVCKTFIIRLINLASANGYKVVVVESVLNDMLYEALRKWGFEECKYDNRSMVMRLRGTNGLVQNAQGQGERA